MENQVSSTAVAHVADAIEFISGDSGYDAVADQAATLLKGSGTLLRTADAYDAGHRSWDELVAEVRACMRPGGK